MSAFNARLFQEAIRAHDAGRFGEAETLCRRVLSRDSNDADALHLLGVLALKQAKHDDAVDLLRRALAARPAWAEAYNNLGAALEARGQWVKAENAFRAASRLKPDYVAPYLNLGNVLRKQGRPAEAMEAYRTAERLCPDDPAPHSGLGGVCLDLGRQRDAIRHYRKWSDLQPDSPSAHSDLLFWLLHDPSLSPEALFHEHLRWGERHERPVRPSGPVHYDNNPDPDRLLRVGYVSPDFREHTVARFIEPVLANHDPSRVVAVCFSDVAEPDEVTRRFRGYVPEWRETAGLSHDALAALVRRERIDVLVDLTGHMGANRLPVFTRRPAPVQATYMAYPHSTGLTSMDWRITDGTCDPVGLTERLHTERLLRLDGCAFAYRPTQSPPVNDLPALSAGADRDRRVTFGMLNRTAKVTHEAIALWARVLRAVPGSRLLVLAAGGETNTPVRKLLESGGINPEGLQLASIGPRQAYLRLAHQVDILLDPLPYSGMTTTCDFLWMGVPTVTLRGPSIASRVGASLLKAVGLPELVAENQDGYVDIARLLAQDLPSLALLRMELRDRMKASPLRDEKGVAARLEMAYRQMWHIWREQAATIADH